MATTSNFVKIQNNRYYTAVIAINTPTVSTSMKLL